MNVTGGLRFRPYFMKRLLFSAVFSQGGSGRAIPSACSFCSSTVCYAASNHHLRRAPSTSLSSVNLLQSHHSSQTLPVLLLPPSLILSHQPYRNAGHSKWQNIKSVKTANDQAKSKELTKFMNFLKVAVKEGGGSTDPSKNSKVAAIIQQIKDAKLPLTAVTKFLQGTNEQKNNLTCIHPLRGPGNCIMLAEIEAPNLMKVKQEINSILRKNKGVVGDNGLLNMFDHKGIIMCSKIDGKPVSEEHVDDAMSHAIEAGANDVELIIDHPEHGTVLEFITEPSAFLRVKGALDKLNYEVDHAELTYIPHNYLDLSDDDAERANKLYEKLCEHPNIANVFVNIA